MNARALALLLCLIAPPSHAQVVRKNRLGRLKPAPRYAQVAEQPCGAGGFACPGAGAADFSSRPQTVRIGVLSLFRPTELTLRAAPGAAVILEAGPATLVLEGGRTVRLRAAGESVECSGLGAASVVRAEPRSGGAFVLAVPGKLERFFRGRLEVTAGGGVLAAVVEMDREIAVASSVAAESPPGAPLEALKAQAVVARSYYAAARGRHGAFQFCDTTHCQFLREPPAPEAPASQAAAQTRPLVIEWRGAPFAALFTASCGGRTRALVHVPDGDYPYFEVECPACRRGTIVNCAYCGRTAGRWANRRGRGAGHGFGLCQSGAAAMAAEGAPFEQILARYFPNTVLAARPGSRRQ